MKDCKVVIPSHKRADRVISKYICSNVIICVAESEETEYREHNPDCEIVTHPDSVKGLLPKRAWMVNHFQELFMIDDDIQSVSDISIKPKHSQAIKNRDVVYEEIQSLYRLSKMLGCSLFGFGNKNNPAQYDEFKPYTLHKKITGCSYGVINSDSIYYNPDLKLKEDFWISGYVMFHEHKVLVNERLRFHQKDTMKNDGGLSSIRNEKEEMRNIMIIKKHFGDSVKLKGSTKYQSKQLKNNIKMQFNI